MKYKLKNEEKDKKNASFGLAFQRLVPFMRGEKSNIIFAFLAVFVGSITMLITPIIISRIVDDYIKNSNFNGVIGFSTILFFVYLIGLAMSYIQIRLMGGVSRRMLFNLRNALFNKLQGLPMAFFDQNKAGDLISRINNDTDKLNQFFSQALMQFVNNVILITGAGIFILALNPVLGLSALVPAVIALILTQIISGWVRKKNLKSLQSLGEMSAEIQESINSFKVIVAFNRLDYFRNKFEEVNNGNYKASIMAGIANGIFLPVYGFAGNIAQLIVLAYGIYLISIGNFTIGLLVGFLLYVNNFYSPLRQLAAVWSSLQLALAGIDRISEILALESDMITIPSEHLSENSVLEFRNVFFSYPEGREVLHNINFTLDRGKTYAFVGPTGGGKTTIASLIARLYDPTDGIVMLNGIDIRSYEPSERTQKIGFILQEPFLFAGTIKDNIVYGNRDYCNYSTEQLMEVFEKAGLSSIIGHFKEGIDTEVISNGDSMSLGQKQIISFIRTTLRKPDILILDEATANVDTVTEQLLEDILEKLPKSTIKIIIAHRLNTIENAEQIFFVNGGSVTLAGSMEQAIDMLMHEKRES